MIATATQPATKPLAPYDGLLTPVLARMIEHRGITSIAELRARRDELAGTTGFNPNAMRLIDRTLEEFPMEATTETARAAEYRVLRRSDMEPWPGLNPRSQFEEGPLQELAASIRQKGLLEPIVVHDRGEGETPRFWVVAGERRYRAAGIAELEELPAVIGVYSEAEALDVALIENLQRTDMSALDEARAFRRRLDLGDLTQEQLAEKVGLNPSTVANRLRLLDLPEGIQKLVDEGVLMPSHARDFILPFAGIPVKKWKELTKRIEKRIRDEAKGLFAKDTLGPRDVRELVGDEAMDLSRSLERREWDRSPALFDPKKHSECNCGGPAFVYGYDDKKTIRCFDEKWWDAQQAEAQARAKEREKKQKEKAAKVAEQGGPRKTYSGFDALGRTHGYDYEIIGQESGFSHQVYDLERIPPANLVFVEDVRGLQLVCLKRSVAGKGSVRKERDQLITDRRRAAAAADLEAAAKSNVKVVDAYRWLVEELLSEDPYWSNFRTMLEDIGIDPDAAPEDADDDTAEFELANVTDADLTTWVKLFVMKSERGDFAGQDRFGRRDDSISAEVDKELRKKYLPALRAFFAAREDESAEATPATNGKKSKGGRKKASAPDAAAAPVASGVAAAAQRAAEAVRMSGIFNR